MRHHCAFGSSVNHDGTAVCCWENLGGIWSLLMYVLDDGSTESLQSREE